MSSATFDIKSKDCLKKVFKKCKYLFNYSIINSETKLHLVIFYFRFTVKYKLSTALLLFMILRFVLLLIFM